MSMPTLNVRRLLFPGTKVVSTKGSRAQVLRWSVPWEMALTKLVRRYAVLVSVEIVSVAWRWRWKFHACGLIMDKSLNARIAYGPCNEERDKIERSLAESISVTREYLQHPLSLFMRVIYRFRSTEVRSVTGESVELLDFIQHFEHYRVDAIFPKPTNTAHSYMMSIPTTTSGSCGLLPGADRGFGMPLRTSCVSLTNLELGPSRQRCNLCTTGAVSIPPRSHKSEKIFE